MRDRAAVVVLLLGAVAFAVGVRAVAESHDARAAYGLLVGASALAVARRLPSLRAGEST